MTAGLSAKISILSQLADVDGDFDMRELAFIYNVGLRNGMDVDRIGDIVANPEPVIHLEDLSIDDQQQCLTDILLLMMIDGKVLPKELEFCLTIAERLGFDAESVRLLVDGLSGDFAIGGETLRALVDALPRIRS